MDSKIESFDPLKTSWQRYTQQLIFYLEANKVEDKLKLPTIYTVMGSNVFNLLCDLIAPADPSSKTVEEVFKILERHYSPKGISRIERFKLRQRMQSDAETISQYAAELRRLSVNCELEDKLNFTLSEQLIFGLKDSAIKKRLIMERNNIDFDELVSLASAAELSSKNLNNLEDKNIFAIKENKNIYKPSSSIRAKNNNFICKHCGGQHLNKFCKFKNATCYICKKPGHIKTVCRFAQNNTVEKKKTQYLELTDQENSSDTDSNPEIIINTHEVVNQLSDTKPIIIKILVDGKIIPFELDTGAAVTILPVTLFKSNWPNAKLEKTNIILRAFDHLIKPIGSKKVTVTFNGNTIKNLELIVTNTGLTALLGRAWFSALGFSTNLIKEIQTINCKEDKLKIILNKFKQLFSNDLGYIKDVEAKLFLKKGSNPKFCKHRPVPYALIPAVENELKKLQDQGILSPVKFSKWAAPIVPILKKNGSLRICGDYKVGLNKCLKVDQYPLPIIEDMLSKLAGGKIFSKLDLAQAYQQVRMERKSAELLTINTHLGLFSVSRLPFGISPAPALFQSIMDTILKRISNVNVICYLDDILITSQDFDSHLKDLNSVFEILEDSGIHLNYEKCEFFKNNIEYLGHVIDENGITPNNSKIKAIMSAPNPENKDQLRSFLSLIGYYRKFIPNLASKLSHLNNLLGKNMDWKWATNCSKQFELVKKELTTKKVLTHFDPNKELILATDASPYGIGAVLSHRFEDRSERPIMFASRSLIPAEKNYSQLDREALSIIYGIKKFHKYIYGRKFTLYTDHKPLTRIFNSEKETPTLAAARIQRWALILAGYNYNIKYKPSKENANADALSRLPISDKASKEENFENIFTLQHEQEFPYTKEDIAIETEKDPELTKIMQYLKSGWPKEKNNKKKDIKVGNFNLKKEQLAIQDKCLLWGLRVIIPKTLQANVLKELHRGHTGIVKMKLLARSVCWWPRIDADIENMTRTCRTCQLNQRNPPKTVVHNWIRPSGPWLRLHTDFMGPFANKMFLVTVDSFSKWPEIKILNKATTETVMYTLEEYFIRFGYPEHIVSDNGTPFTSSAFETFCKNRGIYHSKSPPLHPASNGQAERFVDIAKSFLKKAENLNENNLQMQVNEFLFTYRNTPHATIQLSPAEMLLGRKMRDRLQKVNPLPNLPQMTFKNKFTVGQKVLTKTFGKNDPHRWTEGVIKKVLTPVTFIVTFKDGRETKRHYNQIRPSLLMPQEIIPRITQTTMNNQFILDHQPTRQQTPETPTEAAELAESTQLRYPTRLRKPPDRYAPS